jgi:hypothetical protein
VCGVGFPEMGRVREGEFQKGKWVGKREKEGLK